MPDGHTDTMARWVGRKAVYDGNRNVYAFELMSESEDTLLLTLQSAGVSELTDDLPALLPPGIVLAEGIPPERVILQVPHASEHLGHLGDLWRLGYRLCVDSRDAADYPEAEFSRIHWPGEIQRVVQALRGSRRHAVAVDLQNEGDFEAARSAGADLFSGAFLRPATGMQPKSVSASRLASLRILALCQTPNITVQQLADTIAADAALAFGLLRLANTLLYSRSKPVESLGDVVRRLGTQTVMRWTILLTVAAQQGCPPAYLRLSLQRAHMCEQFAAASGVDPEPAFLTGLLSVLDSIMQVPLPVLLRQVCLAPDITNALAGEDSKMSVVLRAVTAWENGPAPEIGITLEMWLSALARARETFRSLTEVTNPGTSKISEKNNAADALY